MHPEPLVATATTPSALADWLVAEAVATVEDLVAEHLPGWRVPRVYAGHEVAADVRADVCFTLHHLAEAGVTTVAGEPIDDVLVRLLGQVDGSSTHTFFSYRIAETLLRHGPFAGNALAAPLDDEQRGELARAVDSSDWVELLDTGVLPRNYAGVLSRCALGQLRLGLVDDDDGTLDRLVARLAALLGENAHGALDDSNDRIGRYDIYTADVWLFVQPLADRLGPLWADGLRKALGLVRRVGARDGSAVAWGRSVGDLSAALTLELAAVALADGHDPGHEGLWLRRAVDAATTLARGFDPVSTAHRYRNQDGYRGTARRLQMTFDLLGKVGFAAEALRRVPDGLADLRPAPAAEAYPSAAGWVPFEDERPAGVWAVRRPGADLVVPFVGTSRSHYLPTPHQPGTWDVPIDRDLPCWTPLVTAGFGRYTAGGLPSALEVADDGLSVTATWSALPVSGRGLDGDDPGPPLEATRTATYAVDGRTLVLDDRLTFAATPRTVSLAVPEAAGRTLRVDWECDTPHAATTIATDGLTEWRSAVGEIGRVHQLDVDPATEIAYRVRVTPHLRVATTEPQHHYDRALRRPLRDRTATPDTVPVGWRATAGHDLRDVDLLHLHWPEWVAFDDLAEHERIIATLADADVPVVWTAHNLTPHAKQPEAYDPIYQAWAGSVAAAIHHSAWGEARMRDRYAFGSDVRHVVIPHGHFGPLWERHLPSRAAAEARLGLPPLPEGGVRIGIVGAPRAEKRVQAVLDGVAASGRADVQLCCWSLGVGDAAETVPDDPRIVAAEAYREVDRPLYAARLAACDVLALVFDADGEMLATGAAADATGLALPALRSDWGYLVEALGDGGIPCGQTADSIAAAVDALTPDVLAAARAGAERRRAEIGWDVLADDVMSLYERVAQHLP